MLYRVQDFVQLTELRMRDKTFLPEKTKEKSGAKRVDNEGREGVVDRWITHIRDATQNRFAIWSLGDVGVFHVFTKFFPILNPLNSFFSRHICVNTLNSWIPIFWFMVKLCQPAVSRNMSFDQIPAKSLRCDSWVSEDDVVSVLLGVRILGFPQWYNLPTVGRIAGANYDVLQPQ